jgi:hypothetical protein
MFHALKICIFAGAAHYSAYWVLSRLTPYEEYLKKYLIASIAILAVTVFSGMVLLGYLVTVYFCLTHNKKEDASVKIAYFFGIAFTLSYFDGIALSLGVYLGGISFPRVLVLALFVPIVLNEKPNKEIFRYHAVDRAVLFFFMWLAMLSFRAPTFTGMVRANFWLVIDYVILYIAIRRYLTNYSLVFAALGFSLFSQCTLGFLEALMKWHIHSDVEMLGNFAEQVNAQYKFRGAFLRVQASFLNPLIFALFANMAFLVSVIYWAKIGILNTEHYSKLAARGAVVIAVLGTLSSGSRAGIAGSVLIILVSMGLMWAVRRKKDPKTLLVSTFVTAVTLFWIFGQDFMQKHFWYRKRLLELGSEVIMSKPFFGSKVMDQRMEELRQGEGIIDLVNTYIQIGLENGLIALMVFMFAIFGALSKLYDAMKHIDGEHLAFAVFSFASLFILAFNIATTSAFGWTLPWIWVCIAISANLIARVDYFKKAHR